MSTTIDLTSVEINLVDKLAQDLIERLNSIKIGAIIGNWKCDEPQKIKYKDNGDICYDTIFINSQIKGKRYKFSVWSTDDNGKYPLKCWYISVDNVEPGSKMSIHNINLYRSVNHISINQNGSTILESGVPLQGAISKGPITTIDNTKPGWEEKAIEEILDHEVDRENIKIALLP